MFTGIVEELGAVRHVTAAGDGISLVATGVLANHGERRLEPRLGAA